jgi:midasin
MPQLAASAQVDVEAVFAREGGAPFRRLQELLRKRQPAEEPTASPRGASGSQAAPAALGDEGGGVKLEEEAAALRSSLAGVAWTRSMRRMYTLVERCAAP